MLKFAGSALALLVAFSWLPPAQSEGGERHRIIKKTTFRVVDRSGHRHRRNILRIVNRNVVAVRVDGKGRRHHRHHSDGDYYWYSGNLAVNFRNGVGQWSYSFDTDAVTAAAPSARIIDVDTLKADSACQMQAGVCVIRP